jgi:hypothetical protein
MEREKSHFTKSLQCEWRALFKPPEGCRKIQENNHIYAKSQKIAITNILQK